MINEQPTNENNQLTIIKNSIEVFKTAPDVLKNNQLRTARAKQIGEDILTAWSNAFAIEDMDARIAALRAADERSNTFLAKCANALTEEKALRSAITQLMDNFKSVLIEPEYEIDKTKKDSVASKVQTNRNTFVAELARIERERKEAADREAARRKAEIDTRAEIEKQFTAHYQKYLTLKKSQWLEKFNAANTLEDLEAMATKLQGVEPKADIPIFKPLIFSSLLSESEVESFSLAIVMERGKEFIANFAAEMTLYRDELLSLVPARRNEITAAIQAAKKAEEERLALIAKQEEAKRIAAEEAAKANTAAEKRKAEEAAAEAERKAKEELEALEAKAAAERAQAEREKQERDAAELKRIQEEEAEANRIASEKIEVKQSGEQALAMFEKEASLAETNEAPEARQGFDIEVLHPAGYTLIIAHWFKLEGVNLGVDKIGATKCEQMKTFCEKHAHKTGEKIESKYLIYNPTFKAINRKEKVK